MIGNVLWCIVISAVLVLFVGIPYVKGVSQPASNRANNKRDYVVANLEKFQVKDAGTSADGKEIYLISHERMGFKKCP